MSIGARIWSIPDAYLPAAGPPGAAGYVGHESLCVLNAGVGDAHLRLSFFFADREPVRGIAAVVPAGRCRHIRFDRPEELGGFAVPRETPYGLVVESDEPVVVQHSRLDVTQPNMAFLSAIAHPG